MLNKDPNKEIAKCGGLAAKLDLIQTIAATVMGVVLGGWRSSYSSSSYN